MHLAGVPFHGQLWASAGASNRLVSCMAGQSALATTTVQETGGRDAAEGAGEALPVPAGGAQHGHFRLPLAVSEMLRNGTEPRVASWIRMPVHAWTAWP